MSVIDGGNPDFRRKQVMNEGGHQSPTLMAVVTLATIGVLAYAGFLLYPGNRGDWLPYSLVLVGETILLVHALFAMWTILSSDDDPRGIDYYRAKEQLFDNKEIERTKTKRSPRQWRMHIAGEPVEVEVFITTFHEPIEVIRKTVLAAAAMTGAHRTWLLDDGDSDKVRNLAKQTGVRYVRRMSKHGAKAGNLNNALTLAKAPFFLIVDAYFIPEPTLLTQMMPFFADKNVAFVQGPQVYGNMHNLISRGAGYMQTVFYRFIQPGRNRFNAAFSVGTNVIFRRAAIDEVGGMYTDSKSEDVWTSLMLHERGWQSIYISQTVAIGDAPNTAVAFLKQQQRWATGAFEILLTHNPLSSRHSLNMDQRIQYSVTSTFYLTGLTPFILMLVPAMQIYLDLGPINADASFGTWLLFYTGFYGLQILIAFSSMGSFRWEVLLLSMTSFPAYFKALWNVLMERDQAWQATGSTRRKDSKIEPLLPQILATLFLMLTAAVGILKSTYTTAGSLALIWILINLVVFVVFLCSAFRDDRENSVDHAHRHRTTPHHSKYRSPTSN